MRALLKTPVLVLALAAAGCGGDPAPQGPNIDTDPIIPPDEEEAPPALTLKDALSDFGSCMNLNLEAWVRTGMNELYAVETVDENGDATGSCESCHAGQQRTGGIVLDKDIVLTFEEHTHLPAVMRLVTGTIDERGNFKDLVSANRYVEKGSAVCLPEEGFECHPQYELQPEMEEAINDFVHEMLDRWHSDNCDAPYAPANEEQ
jgi:hypothetical protein